MKYLERNHDKPHGLSNINKNDYVQINSGHMIQFGDSQDFASIFGLSI